MLVDSLRGRKVDDRDLVGEFDIFQQGDFTCGGLYRVALAGLL